MREPVAGAARVHVDEVRGPRGRAVRATGLRRSERIASAGAGDEHVAGRVAAKRAVLDLLGLEPGPAQLADVEVLPRPGPLCRRSAECLHGHPPGVTLHGALALRFAGLGVRVSISHTRSVAVAVAVLDPAAAPNTAPDTGPDTAPDAHRRPESPERAA